MSFTASAMSAQRGSASTTISAPTTRSKTRFVAHCAPAKIGGRSSNSGTPCPGTYSPRSISSSVVRGATRTFTPRRCAVRRSPAAALGEPAVRDDQLVERLAREACLDVGLGIDLADEVVVDAAALAPSDSRRCARASSSPTSTTFRRTPAARSMSREHLVARAEEADQDRDEDRTDDVEAERREVLSGADREREREPRDEDHARHDPSAPSRISRGA